MTDKQTLIERELGEPVVPWIARRRQRGSRTSWRHIAADLEAETKVSVTAETLRLWYDRAKRNP